MPLSALGFSDEYTNTGFNLKSPATLAPKSIVSLSLLTLWPGAVFSTLNSSHSSSLLSHPGPFTLTKAIQSHLVGSYDNANSKNVVDPSNQLELARLANCAIDIYAITAVLGRASRSYSIGVRNADHEVLLAITFCQEALNRIKIAIKEIEDGPFISTDSALCKIADAVIHNKGYVAEHPLTRVFW
ncbi:acyl-CoA dehydrogenase [Halocaridina rubra]|uniref:Acyl-CoA dehydrogenase n=1 Tax=Halocaridina rubra TaxID=373956 RepID=A0AAN9AG91_HALRR